MKSQKQGGREFDEHRSRGSIIGNPAEGVVVRTKMWHLMDRTTPILCACIDIYVIQVPEQQVTIAKEHLDHVEPCASEASNHVGLGTSFESVCAA